MFSEISKDLKGYISENRDLLYTIGLVLIIDQYIFDGAFRQRIKNLVEGLLKKAENKAGVVPPQ